MGTFFKTFFVCLLLTFGFLGYKYFSTESYNTNLSVSKESPVFGLHEDYPESTPSTQAPQVTNNDSPKVNKKNEVKKYTHTCFFYSADGKLTPIKRELSSRPSLETTINLLLKGPTIPETKKGIYSEIPANVDLISVRNESKGLIVNLSSNFGNGGGSQSIENRVKQLSKTIKTYSPSKPIYLYINGKEVEYLGGDGVFIKQPLE